MAISRNDIETIIDAVTKQQCRCQQTKRGGRCYMTAVIGSDFCKFHTESSITTMRFLPESGINDFRYYLEQTLEVT